MFRTLRSPGVMAITLAAAGILMMTAGIRMTNGLFLSPINSSTGLGIVSLSLAMAIGQFVWGAVQPLAGALADRHGARPVLLGGVSLMAVATAATPFMTSAFGISVMLGVLSAAGAGAASFSVLMGAVAQRMPAESRGEASGFINAGSSIGQFVFAPVAQKLIQLMGWMGAMWALAALALLALPLVHKVTANTKAAQVNTEPDLGLRQTLRDAFKTPSYGLIHAGFFTCGFHIAFLVTHLPGEVDLCGLPPEVASWSLAIIGLANIAGSLLVGSAVSQYRSKMILALMYASRAALLLWYLWMPKTDLTFYLFAAGLGLTWLATVPPTAALVGKLFGIRYMGTLFGMTLLSHQIGGFLGAWLGGLAITQQGDYTWMWYADIALAVAAALLNLPIKEAPVRQTAAA
ncbi:MFS transporter [Limnohabitans sp. Rim8]|uniref:MFS transporter n=1 Tax=Limnohabitans sp. Rim8 TaxID=1100718 RepID=UPI002618C6D5|nr:MFS transporter [Limnohabitans sp. Rim8]